MIVYLKSKKDSTFLKPFIYKEHWVSNIDEAYDFHIEEKDLKTIKPIDLVNDIFLDKEDIEIVYIDNEGKEVSLKKDKTIFYFKKQDYLILKKEFNEAKDKRFEHYLIYSFIKSQKTSKSISYGSTTFLKIISFIELVDNYKYSKHYLKYPFPSIRAKDFQKILKDIKKELMK